MCRKGEIRVDGARAQASTRLAEGQVVRLPPIPEPDAPLGAAPGRGSLGGRCRDDPRRVIWRDDDVLALNKPPGLAVQGGSGQTRHRRRPRRGAALRRDEKPRLVHRLDRDTSGVLLLARSARAAAGLASAFQARDARKIYWAVIAGVPRPAPGTIRYGLVKAPGHGAGGEGEKMIARPPRRGRRRPRAPSAPPPTTV